MTDRTSPGTFAHSSEWAPTRRLINRLPLIGLGLVTLLALGLNFWTLERNGYGNDFYAASVISMTKNWSNFFFAAFDPPGFVTVDKPPLSLWVTAASVKLFGFSSLSVLGPSALAGGAAVAVLTRTVWRVWGAVAGLVAGLVLALTPVALVVWRSNNTDAIMNLLLVLSAWAAVRAVQSGRLRWVLATGLLVGLAFNAKTLAAYLVVPGFVVAYLITGTRSWRIRVLHLVAAGVVLAVVSAAWITAVDLVPASLRPWVDSTQDNSEWNLTTGYNGLQRIFGGGLFSRGAPGGAARGAGGAGLPGGSEAQRDLPRGLQPFTGGGPGGAAAASFGGATGWNRLLTGTLGGQASWLLPFALVGAISDAIAGLRTRDRVRLAALIVFGGWAAVAFVVFSYSSGTFHPYYLAELAPPVAALVGLGVVSLWRDVLSRSWAAVLPLVALAGTAALQVVILRDYPRELVGWRTALVASTIVLGVGLMAWAFAGRRLPRVWRAPRSIVAGALGVGLAALLVAPVVWSGYTITSTVNGTIPQAGPQTTGAFGGGGFGGPQTTTADTKLISYLEAHRGNVRYLVATSNSQSAAPLIMGTDGELNVISLGGFLGSDPILTPTSLARLVEKGELRYVLIGGGFGRGAGGGFPDRGRLPEDIARGDFPRDGTGGGAPFAGGGGGTGVSATQYVSSVCTEVPSKTAGTSGLYDCGGKGVALLAAARKGGASTGSGSPTASPSATPSTGSGQPSGEGGVPPEGGLPGGGGEPGAGTRPGAP